RTAIPAALLCRRTVLREPANVWLLRYALAALAAGVHGAGFDWEARRGVADSATTRGSSLCSATGGTGGSPSATAECACGRTDASWRAGRHATYAGPSRRSDAATRNATTRRNWRTWKPTSYCAWISVARTSYATAN